MKIIYFVNNAAFFVSHRLAVALGALAKGYQAELVIGQPGDKALELVAYEKLRQSDISFTVAGFTASGMNPALEFFGLCRAFIAVRKSKPDLMHCVSPKGVIYGGLIARLVGVPSLVLAISGMGLLFSRNHNARRYSYRVAGSFYKFILMWILKHPNIKVIVQNKDDKNFLVEQCKFDFNKVNLIQGSGIELDNFIDYPINKKSKSIIFPARLLISKGVNEFIEAAKLVRINHPDWRFVLVGSADYQSPDIISSDYLRSCIELGIVEWLGHVELIAPILGDASIVCLPSYREGMPKALLESAAAGCAVVTTDAIGCKEAIIPGVTGELVPIGDLNALASSLIRLIEDPCRRMEYGAAGREYAKNNFGIKDVVVKNLNIYQELAHDE